MKRILRIIAAILCTALGFIGVFIPVLPTTPLLLLAAFLFSRSSRKLDAWLKATKVYRTYVGPFKASGGIPLGRKIGIVSISFSVMGISALLVQRWYVWLVLACVAAWLIYLMFVRIPTVSKQQAQAAYAKAYKEVTEETAQTKTSAAIPEVD